MPFEPGNKLAVKGKVFDAALRRAIAQSDGDAVRKAADALLVAAGDGEPWAIGMLADRLDGKAPQSVEVKTVRSIEEMTLDQLRDRVAEMLGAESADRGGAALQ